MDLRYIYRDLKGPGDGSFQSGSAGPANISFTVPIHKKIGAAFGVRPFSTRDFVFFDKQYLSNDSIGIKTRGSGGTTQFFISSGVKIAKGLSIGLETSYIMGTLEDSVTFGALPSEANFNFISVDQRKVSQFLFKPGMQWLFPLKKDSKKYLCFGAAADLGGVVQYKKFNFFTIKGSGGNRDTLALDQTGKINRPLTYTAGIGFIKDQNWGIGLDLEYAQAPEQSAENSLVKNKDALSVRIGGEYTIGTQKSTRYLNIITLRGGLAYNQLPLEQNGKQVFDRKVSLGASFPIIRKEAKFSRPLINFGFVFGQRGLENSALGLENYYQISLGFTLNDFLWFNRYRID